MNKRIVKGNTIVRLCTLLAVLIFGACASSTIFIPYPHQMHPFKEAANNNDLNPALEKLNKKIKGANKNLLLMEHGRLSQLNKSFEESKSNFEQVITSFQEKDDKAHITATGASGFVSTLVSNDNAKPYDAEGYERVFVHHFQSLNFLAQNDIEGAMVEIRRAQLEQDFALEAHHKELAKSEKKSNEKEISLEKEDYQSQFSALNEVASKVKNSFQNAYTFYYSAVIQESLGETNDAYIDYKKALEIFPENTFLQSDVLRLSKQLSMTEAHQEFEKQFAGALANQATNSQGSLVILYEEGFAPEKSEIAFPLMTFHSIHSFALPTYSTPWQPSLPLRIKSEHQYLGQTKLIVDVYALAAKSLQEKTFSRIVRQAIRVSVKARIQREAREQVGALGGLVASIYSLVSERADLRSFLTLPQNAQISRFNLEEGSHTIQLSNAILSKSIPININKGRISLIRVINTNNNHFIFETYNL